MSMPKRLSLLLLSTSLFFTSACSDEAQLAEQCETGPAQKKWTRS